MPTFAAACWVEYVFTLVYIAYLRLEVTKNRVSAGIEPWMSPYPKLRGQSFCVATGLRFDLRDGCVQDLSVLGGGGRQFFPVP